MKVGSKVKFIANPLPRFPGDPGISDGMVKIVESNMGKTFKVVRELLYGNPRWLRIDLDEGAWQWDPRWLVEVGPQRDARGRFIKKGAEQPKAPEKKEEPKPKFPNAIGETVRDELTKKVDAKGVGTCSYAIQYEKGTIFQVGDVCHARLRAFNQYHELGNGKVLFAALNMKGHVKDNKDDPVWQEVFRKFLHWALNESSFKNCFITKDVNEAIEKGILLNIEENDSRVVASAVFLRSLTEYPKTVQLLKELLDKGVPMGIAWIISQGVTQDKKYKGYSGAHHCIVDTMPTNVLINGIINGMPLPEIEGKSFKDSINRYQIFKAVSGLDLYWGGNQAPPVDKQFGTFVKSFAKAKIRNGFGEVSGFSDADLMKLAFALKK